jgi:hypothetical protein
MREIFSNADLHTHFLRDGFVRVPMLSPDEVRGLLAEFPSLHPDDQFRREWTRNGQTTLTYHCSFLDRNLEYKRRTRDLLSGAFSARLDEILNGYELLNANFYVKPPGAGVFQIHQNWSHLADRDDTTLTVWCPLTDASRRNGTLEVVPGSHKIFPDIPAVNTPPFFRDFEDALVERYLQPMALSAGEALVFDDNLIHWSSQNDSDQPRIAVQLLCIPRGSQPVYYHFDPRRPEVFEMFEVDAEYFVTHSAEDLPNIPRERRSLGVVPNPNRFLTEREFAARLAEAAASRARSHAHAASGSAFDTVMS